MTDLLSFYPIKSTAEKIASDIVITEAIKPYRYVLCVCTDGVWLKSTKEADTLCLDRMVDLRAFDESGELHVCRVNGALRGRVRTDGTGTETDCTDEEQLLWGTSAGKTENGCTRLWDDRGIALTVPFVVPKGERVFLKVRRYLSPDTAVFTDYRLCGLSCGKAVKEDGR